MTGDDSDRKVAYAVGEEDGPGRVYDTNPDRKLDKLPTEEELQDYVDYFKYNVCFSS